jgi:hypothetical protein
MLTNQNNIDFLSKLIYEIDKICRVDFSLNNIVSERDYVSNFLNFIRYPFGPFGNSKIAYSQTLNGSLEQKYGADGIIIFKKGNEYKIGVFEAKIVKQRWDSTIGRRPNTSRFQRQLLKQIKLNSNIAVWEMFFNIHNNKFQFDNFGSTCVKRDIALAYQKKNKLWSYFDLENLALDSYKSNQNIPINIEQIIREMLTCKFGSIFDYREDGVSFYAENGKVKIPLIKQYDGRENMALKMKVEIKNFLKNSKLHSYTHIDLDNQTVVNREMNIVKILMK